MERGGYTNRIFWKEILTYQKLKSKPVSNEDFKKEMIKVTSKEDFIKGSKEDFLNLLNNSKTISQEAVNIGKSWVLL
ncbi:hypothetical protein LCGC14_0957640 [marine sediment metagenome]|uniref:Uncharacterized protein n=1 Tax=marine sediment metagenome TaxID=412755 RepID=A0A0F9QYQ0_9ZZZZ|nr:MAG: hypothetical protein Lokiarch_22630 [Candidatus Lokiarchaeum sp. GC14_75]HDZ18866.1 hypothetical protein [archaeon]HEC38872.1 hypothetical protein [bacterium]